LVDGEKQLAEEASRFGFYWRGHAHGGESRIDRQRHLRSIRPPLLTWM
jgi:hypothetical protein